MKFLTTTLIFVGLIFLFNAGGLETASGGLVKLLIEGGLTAFATSELWSRLTLILGGTILVGSIASLFGRAPDVSWVLATVASLIGGLLLADMLEIWRILSASTSGWIEYVVLTIMGLMLYGFFISLISWWRGAE